MFGCIHVSVFIQQGEELKAALMKSGGDFKRVEVHAKQMIEKKRTKGNLEREVTQLQLKEIYHWDQLGPEA